MLKFLYVGIGGAIGALLRYCISGSIHKLLSGGFPWGTLSVNLLGSLIMGFLWGLFEVVIVSENIRLLFFIGILGSFTTFSTFSLENFNLLKNGKYGFFTLNITASLLFGIGLIFVGYFISRYVFSVLK